MLSVKDEGKSPFLRFGGFGEPENFESIPDFGVEGVEGVIERHFSRIWVPVVLGMGILFASVLYLSV